MTICMAAALLIFLLALPALAAGDTVRMDFEDGFSLELPSQWVTFEVPDVLSDQGIAYMLGTPDAARVVYIQLWNTQYESLDALRADLSKREDIDLPAAQEDGSFLIYNFTGQDTSGCLTLHNDHVLNLMFKPQSDPDGMAIAAKIMESCKWVEVNLE